MEKPFSEEGLMVDSWDEKDGRSSGFDGSHGKYILNALI
jgi:hypothetical protein